MDFDKIVLSDSEVSLLKDVRDHCATYADPGIERLIELGLVQPNFLVQSTSSSCDDNSEISITDSGLVYLTYLENTQREKMRDQRHDWLIAIFSTLGGAILSKPIWDGIDFILDLIKRLSTE